ncbi:MAG: phage tail protein [Methylovulum sp.]|nr:phage tail protein [Methylovulum sp.]
MIEVRGAGGGGKGGSGGGHESDDTLFSTAYIEVIEVISEGLVKGLVNGAQSIYLNDTPIVAADGLRNHKVSCETRIGWQGQSPFPIVQSVSAETSIGTLVQQATPIIATITNDQADYAVVTLGFPRMMHVDDKGNIDGAVVEFKIECQAFGGSYALVSRTSALTRGGYDATQHYFRSPDASYFAECYLAGNSAGPVTLQHSTDGSSFSDLETVTLSKVRDNGYTASVRVNLTEGVHFLRWGDDSQAFYALYNSVQWSSYGAAGTITIDGKSGSRYQKQYRFPLAGAAPWSVRVTRITEDSDSAKLSNELYFDSLRTEVVALLNYPNTALIYYKIPAKEFSSIPRRRSEWDLLEVRVPSNYDPISRAYTGVWDGSFKTAWTDNPAWCFYDVCVSGRYGLGQYINAAGINKWVLYEIGKYCDGLVDSGRRDETGAVILEPRFTLNIQIVQAREAFEWLRDLASVFRGMMYVINGMLTCVADRPSDPVRLFNQTNVINGQFKFNGTAALARKTVALVEWRDPDDLYNKKVEYVPNKAGIKRYGRNPTEVVAVGCTSRGQAHRLGNWLLLDGEVVIFQVAHDTAFVMPGDIIQCVIPLRSKKKRLGGRLKSIVGTEVTLDAPVSLTAGHDYQLSVVLADGSISSRNIVFLDAITTDVLTIASTFDGEIVDQALWVLIDWDGIQPSNWRVLGLTGSDGITKTITALSHNPDKFAAIDTFNTAIDASLLPAVNPLTIAAVAAITIENLPFTDKNDIVQNKLHVHWMQVQQAARYQVRWRLNSGNWHSPPMLTSTLFEMIIKDDGTYHFEIVAVSVLGMLSSPAQASVAITGDASPLSAEAQPYYVPDGDTVRVRANKQIVVATGVIIDGTIINDGLIVEAD